MAICPPLPRETITDKNGKLLSQWMVWVSSVYQNILLPVGQTGTTAQRPTTNLWVGQQYFDTTLGYPVFVKTIGPPAVWVNGSGGVV